VRWAEWNFHTRAALLAPMVGTRLVLVRESGQRVTLVAHPDKKRALPATIVLIKVLFLLVAGLLALRRWENRAVRSLIAFLFSFGFSLAFSGSNPVGSSELSFVLFDLGSFVLLVGAAAAAADFSVRFSASPSAAQLLFARGTIASAAIVIVMALAVQLLSVGGQTLHKVVELFIVLPFALAVATLVAGYVSARGAERSRRLWVLAIIGVGLLGPAIDVLLTAVWGYNAFVDQQVIVVTVAVIPVGLAYVILRHRLIDVGFVLNQAAIYAGVSIVVVGVFAIVETLLANYLQRVNHVTSTAIQLGIALAIGYSINAIHKRVEQFVDRVLFRERHEAERAMREFATEAAYVTEAPVLLERCVQTVRRQMGASAAGVWMRNDAGAYLAVAGDLPAAPSVDANDPAVLAMRARHAVVDLDRTDSALPGILAFPMASSGELLGTLVCDVKRNRETYAPDERASLQEVATAVAHAWSALRVRELQQEIARLSGFSAFSAP
jgi:GAF domain-containing protein